MTSLHCCSLWGQAADESEKGNLHPILGVCLMFLWSAIATWWEQRRQRRGSNRIWWKTACYISTVCMCSSVGVGCVWVMCVGNIPYAWSFRNFSRTEQTWCRAITYKLKHTHRLYSYEVAEWNWSHGSRIYTVFTEFWEPELRGQVLWCKKYFLLHV